MSELAHRRFLKMHGAGNQIVVLDLRGSTVTVRPEEARAIVGRIDTWLQDRREVRVEDADIDAATRLLERFDLKLRTGDALHLAISRRLNAHLATFDNDLASAAEAVGQRLVRG